MKTLCYSMLAAACLLLTTTLFAQTPAKNKETTRKIIAAVDAGNAEAFAAYLSPNFDEHMPMPEDMKGMSDAEASKVMIAGYHKSFPDSKTDIQKMVAEGDIVMIYSVWSGTNTGEFMGMPPTNKPVKMDQVDIIRFDASGKAVEHWAVYDNLTMMEQLGMMSK